MARKTFTDAIKKQAVAMMTAGTHTQKQIADKYGCSVASLQVWRQELNANQTADDDEGWDEDWDDEPAESAATPCGCKSTKKQDGTLDITRQFWNKNYRGVDMLLTPKEVSSDDVVKLVNEAIQFACEKR